MKNIALALLNAQKQIESVDKDAKNPFFKSDYTTLNAAIVACKRILNDNNIIVLQPIVSDENGVYVATTLIHTSGEVLESKHRIREAKANDPQAQGSAITYARRYSLMSMLCMSSDDDDGEKAMNRKPKKDGLTAICKTHNVEMKQRWSEKTQSYHWYHTNEKNEYCFGKEYLERK